MAHIHTASLGALTPEDIRQLDWASMQDQPLQDDKTPRVCINTQSTYQTINGIGGSFSEIGGGALQSLPAEKRDSVLNELFGKSGAAFSYCRFPIGASDFAYDAYSLNDHDGDYAMEKFSLERDEQYLLPFIKDALAVNPELKLHASPWSPPAWMKNTGHMDGGGMLIDTPEIYRAYALYLQKVITGYAERGVEIERLLIQNEPDSCTAERDPKLFPMCLMPPDVMTTFAVEYLKPAFEAAALDTEIWAGTFRTITGLQSHRCMENEAFRNLVKGCGFQYSFADPIRDLAQRYPDKGLMHTESVCYDSKNTPAQAVSLFYDFLNYMQAGCSVYTYWNMILDENQISSWGWKQNSLFTIDRNTGTVTENPDMKVMRLLASNIQPGAVRIESFCFLRKSIAFRNPDGGCVAFILNNGDEHEIELEVDGRLTKQTLPAGALSAIHL